MTRVPLLAGSRITIAEVADDAVVVRPPPPIDGIADVGAAVRDALRFPLAGAPLEALVPRRGARVTVVVEPPALPVPGSVADPRQAAIAATVDELERLGVRNEAQTLLVASGLGRRPGRRELEALVTPEFARRFRGRVLVHDAADPDLVELDPRSRPRLAVSRALVETDAVVTVTAAETVLHGGPAALVGAAGGETLQASRAYSLLETAASQGWRLALALERALARRTPLIGVSLALQNPTAAGALRGYPHDQAVVERVAASRLPLAFSALPGAIRGRILRSRPVELAVSAAFGGPPSVAHAEALLRAIEERAAAVDGQLDALCIGIPPTTPHLPRERPNPLLAAYLGLGLALRLWRDRFPIAEGGTAILVHPFDRHFAHPTQQPYRTFFQATRGGRDPELLAAAERDAQHDERAIEAYRAGRSCHPLLPFRDWAACEPAIGRLGAVLVAGCRDAVAARQLGFVPTRGLAAALEMARGRAGGNARIGFLLSPPFFPLRPSSSRERAASG